MSAKRSDQGELHESQFGKMPEALLHDLTITDGAKVLYAHMHWRYGDNKRNFEGQASMGEMLGVNRATISKRIEELEAKDWIVTVQRKTKTGNFCTPYYHVFVNQDECRAFRQTFIPSREGETLLAKPLNVKGRQSRAGKGGKPENLKVYQENLKTTADHTNSNKHGRANSSEHGHANSNKHGRANSSEHYPDSSYLDSLYPDSDLKSTFTPEGVGVAALDISLQQPQKPTVGNAFEPFIENELFKETTAEKPIEPEPQPELQPESKPQPATKPPRPRDELFDVISELWGIKTGGWVANIKAMLTGTAKKGAYAQCNFDVPATPAEIRDFAKWWKSQDFVQDKNLKLPTQPDTIQRRFYEYRDSRPKFKVVVEPETPLPPVIHRQPGEPIAMTGDDVMAMIANGAKAWEF